MMFDGLSTVKEKSKVKGATFEGAIWVRQIAIDTAKNRAYVPNGNDKVMVVDCQTDSIITTLVMGSANPRVNVSAVNQSRSLLFVSAWNETYDKIFSTVDNQFIPPDIDEAATDNWQTLIHEQLNIACRSYEIDARTQTVDLERHSSKAFRLDKPGVGALIAMNQKSARAFYFEGKYSGGTVAFDLLTGTRKELAAGCDSGTVSHRFVPGGFNQITEELYVPDRVGQAVDVIRDDSSSGPPFISSIQLNSNRSLVLRGTCFGILQGTSEVAINGVNLGTASSWSPDSITFESNPNIGSGLLTITVFGRSLSSVIPTDVDATPWIVPESFRLEQNYPNPFNPATVFGYDLPRAAHVQLKVYDVLGREVATLVDELQQPGSKSAEFHAEYLPSGVYFYRLQAGTFTETRKLILLR